MQLICNQGRLSCHPKRRRACVHSGGCSYTGLYLPAAMRLSSSCDTVSFVQIVAIGFSYTARVVEMLP